MKYFCQIVDGEIVQVSCGFEEPPFGNAVEVPDDIVANINDFQYINGEFVKKEPAINLPSLIQIKIADINQQCFNIIIAGFDSTAKGGVSKHYSLSLTDQTNIQALMRAIDKGATSVPWHNSEQTICELWTASEFTQFYNETMEFVTRTRFYSDGLCELAGRATTQQDIEAVQWGITLPDDIQTQISSMLGG